MPPTERKSTAKSEGYLLIGDQELLNGVENRIRQLESERAGHMIFLDEAKALEDESAATEHQKVIDEHNVRLKACYARRDALKANMPKADGEQPS